MITKEQALSLRYRDLLFNQDVRDSRGGLVVCRVNGACKTWVTRPNYFRLPVKYGLRDCFYITPDNAKEWCYTEEDALLHPLRKEDDWSKYVEKTGLRPTRFICSKCKEKKDIPPKEKTISVGYANNNNGDLVCFECCAKEDKKYMAEHGKIMLYLTGIEYNYKLSNWPGSLKFKVFHSKEGNHNWAGIRYDVWFRVPDDDYIWHGVQYGKNTQICHCKRVKERWCNGER